MQGSAATQLSMTGEFRSLLLIERKDEAAHIAEFLLRPNLRLAVLYGRVNCGKTKLVRNFVIPELRRKGEVYFGAAAPDLPETVSSDAGELPLQDALDRGATVFIDDFDMLLSAGGKARMERAGALLKRIERAETGGRLVLILQEDNLSYLLAFRADAPSLLDNTFEIQGLPLEQHIRRLGEAGGAAAISYEPAVIAQLGRDLDEFGASGYGDIAEAVDCGIRHYKGNSPDRVVTSADYENALGLKGILRRSLDARMEAADSRFGKGAGRITEAIAEEVVESSRTRRPPDFAGIAARLDLPPGLAAAVLEWAAGAGRLVKAEAKDAYSLIPKDLGRVLEEEIKRQAQHDSDARRILADGVRTRNPLSASLFEQVNRPRTRLRTDPAETALMAISALHLSEGANDAAYWLRRLPDREARVSVLIEALFSPSPEARRQAAALLAAYEDEDVRNQLYRRALEDADPHVRRQALSSLEGMATQAFWPLMEQEARDASSPFRLHAIEALRLCRSPHYVATLEQIAGEPVSHTLRAAAIQTLAALSLPEAVDALVRIGLDSEDPRDREAAASALQSLTIPELADRALEQTRIAHLKIDEANWIHIDSPLSVGARILLSLLLAAANAILHGAALIPARRYRLAALFLTVQIVCAAVLSGFWFQAAMVLNWGASHMTATRAAMASAGADWWSFRVTHILGSVFFCLCMPVFAAFHGSAHALMGRWRPGLKLLAAEVVGIGLCVMAWYTFFDYRLAHHSLEQIFYLFFFLYAGAGLVLFAASFWRDVKEILYERFLMADRREARQRKQLLLAPLVAAPAGTQALMRTAASQTPDAARWARGILNGAAVSVSVPDLLSRFESAPEDAPRFLHRSLAKRKTPASLEALAALWDRTESEPVRKRILGILLSDPTEASLDLARHRAPRLGTASKFLYKWTRSSYPLRLWPRVLTWGVGLMLPFVFYASAEAIMAVRNPAHSLLHHMRSNLSRVETEQTGVKTAHYLADVYARESAHELSEAYQAARTETARRGLGESLALLACSGQLTPDLRRAALAPVAVSPAPKTPARDILEAFIAARPQCKVMTAEMAEVLTGHASALLADARAAAPQTRLALKALEVAATEDAIHRLRDFASAEARMTSLDQADKALREQRTRREKLDLKLQAVDALVRISTPNAFRALEEVAMATASPELRDQIYERLRSAPSRDPLARVEAAFSRANYPAVLAEGRNAANIGEQQRPRLFYLLGEANYRLSRDAAGTNRDKLENEAIGYFSKALAVRATDTVASRSLAEIRNLRAERFRAAGDLTKAFEESSRAVAADPTFPEALATHGIIQRAMGASEDALRSLAHATELDPKYTLAYSLQAEIYLDLGGANLDLAEKMAMRAIESDPNYSWSYVLLKQSYTHRGNVSGAIDRLEALERRYPKTYWPGQQLANLYHDYGAKDEAAFEKAFQKWSQLDHDFGPLLDELTRKNHRANFLESAFTSGRHARVLKEGPALAAQLSGDPSYQIAVRLLIYASALIENDRTAAREQLQALDLLLARKDVQSEWEYAGTIAHAEAVKRAPWGEPLLDLLRAANQMQEGTPVPRAILERNRKAI